MATVVMREIREGEVPRDGGTALQDDVDRPVFRGNGPDDYVCVQCGNVLAESMDSAYMTKKVRVKCARCKTVNVAITGD
jgi:DNA-directed RNA polymerase subunit RPC12/RpoP